MFASRSWRFLLLSCLLGVSPWMMGLSDASLDAVAVSPTRVLEQSQAPSIEGENTPTDEKAGEGGAGDEGGGTDGADEDPCAAATTCADCETASESLTDGTEVCSWALGPSEGIECMKKQKKETEDTLGDMCSTAGGDGTGSDGAGAADGPAPTDAPDQAGDTATKTPANGSELIIPDEDEGNGVILAIFLLVVFVGIVYSNRDKMFKILRAADGVGGGETSATASRPVKYSDLSGVDEDEEWGWGDNKDGSGGDIELPGSDSTGSIGSYKDEVVHKRNTSFDVKDPPVSFGSGSASPLSTRAVAPALSGGGLNLSSSATNPRGSNSGSATPVKSGMSFMSKQQKPKPNKPPTSATPAVAQPMPTSVAMQIPQRITSLGKKKPVARAKPKPTTKPPEDDIFASMGLSAKPKFSAPPTETPKTAPAPTSSSAESRWAMAATTAAASNAVNAPSTLSANFSDEGADDDDWEDDDDLNDLLDD